MNREIKFRVWDNIGKKLYNWPIVVSNYIGDNNCTLQQYIGIKDFNNKEVFEGDIVRLIGGTKCGIVEYNYTSFGMNIMGYILPLINCEFEVVGNIFENGDLLR